MIVVKPAGDVLEVEVRAHGGLKVVTVYLWLTAILACVGVAKNAFVELPLVTIACERAAAKCTRSVDGQATKAWSLSAIRAVEAPTGRATRGGSFTTLVLVRKDGTRERLDGEPTANDVSVGEYTGAAAAITAFLAGSSPSVTVHVRARGTVGAVVGCVFMGGLFGLFAFGSVAGTNEFRFDRAKGTLFVVRRRFPIGRRRESVPLADIDEIDETRVVRRRKGGTYTSYAVELDRRSPGPPVSIASSGTQGELAPLVAALSAFLRVPVKIDP